MDKIKEGRGTTKYRKTDQQKDRKKKGGREGGRYCTKARKIKENSKKERAHD